MSIVPVLSPMSELDAVNMMLLSIGQAPVNTLDITGIKDVSFARLMLHNTSRQVQARGWWFNRELKYKLTPDVNKFIFFPDNVLEIAHTEGTRDLVERNRQLYDRDEHKFTFDEPVEVNIVWFLAFASLPQIARDYIATRAARVFQTQIVGSQILYQYTKEMEMEAGAIMTQQDLRAKRLNAFSVPTRVNRIIHRR